MPTEPKTSESRRPVDSTETSKGSTKPSNSDSTVKSKNHVESICEPKDVGRGESKDSSDSVESANELCCVESSTKVPSQKNSVQHSDIANTSHVAAPSRNGICHPPRKKYKKRREISQIKIINMVLLKNKTYYRTSQKYELYAFMTHINIHVVWLVFILVKVTHFGLSDFFKSFDFNFNHFIFISSRKYFIGRKKCIGFSFSIPETRKINNLCTNFSMVSFLLKSFFLFLFSFVHESKIRKWYVLCIFIYNICKTEKVDIQLILDVKFRSQE